MLAYYEARAPEYDDWYLRRGRYERGPIHDAAWNAELDAAGRWLDDLPIRGEIVELAAGTGWWSPLLAVEGRAVALRRARRAARARPRAPGRAQPARAPPRARRVGRTRPAGRCRLHRFLAEPRPARSAGRVPRDRPALAQAGRDVRVHRFAAGPPVERGRPPDADRRRLASVASTTAANSRSSRSTTSPTSSRRRCARAGFEDARVTTTGRFFLTGVATAGQ